MALAESRNGYFLIRIEGQASYPLLQDVSAFLYDFNLVYDISRLATDPKYSDYRFTRSVWYRTRKPLTEQDRLHVDNLQLGSPFILETILAVTAVGVPAVYGIVQIAEKIADWKVNREIRRLERDKLAMELRQNDLPPPPDPHTLAETLQSRGALRYGVRRPAAARADAPAARAMSALGKRRADNLPMRPCKNAYAGNSASRTRSQGY